MDSLHGSDHSTPAGWGAMRQDTARIRAELELSEHSLRLATDAAEVGTWDLDLTTNVLTWSGRTKAMFGLAADASCSMADFYASLHPDDLDATAAAFALTLDPVRRATYDVEYRVVDKNSGAVHWVEAKGRGIFGDHGRCVRAVGTAVDITVRKSAEQRLRASEASLAESEQKFRAITDSIDHMVWSTLPDGQSDFFNQRWHDYTGVVPGSTDFKARNYVLHPDDRDQVRNRWRDCVATGYLYELEYRMRHWSGAYRWVLGRAVPIRDDQGRITHWFGTCTDIQDIVEARETTARSHEHLEHEVAKRTQERDRTWRNSQDLLVVRDKQGVLRAVNPAWTTVLGWREDELVGHDHLDLTHPDDRQASRNALEKAGGDGLPRYESRLRHQDGTYRWVAWVAVPEDDMVHASGRHVTAEKEAAQALRRTEEQLRQSQKMEAIGQLTGGIAHDFNNMLAGIIGSLELLQRRIDAGRFDGLERYATMAATSAHSAAALTQRLLAFARRRPLDPKRVEADRLLAGMEDLLQRTLGRETDLEIAFADALWPTLCDPNQLENAILNLAINARDAMPKGGRLTIEAANVHLDDAYAQAQGDGVKPGQYVVVSVTDTGTGMGPEVIKRAFEPFFTTKRAGEGTGLGLSMLYGFIKQSGGHVRVHSELGQGTTFKVYLPRCRDEAAAEPVEPAARVLAAETLGS